MTRTTSKQRKSGASWRANLECVDRAELEQWAKDAGTAAAQRRLTRADYRMLDTARRWLYASCRAGFYARLHAAWWMPRAQIFAMARLSLRHAKESRDRGITGAARIRFDEAMEWRTWAKMRGPTPEFDAEWREAQAKQATQAEKPAKVRAIEEPRQVSLGLAVELVGAAWSQWHLDRFEAERAERKARRDAMEARWAATAAEPEQPPRPLAPGDAVILDGTDRAGWSVSMPRRAWVVVSCDCGPCASGSHVALDVPTAPSILELYPDHSPWRHVSVGAVRRRGEASAKVANSWADALAMGCGVGQALHWVSEDGRNGVVQTARSEFASLVLADAMGGAALTEEQGGQFDRWKRQRGGEVHDGE